MWEGTEGNEVREVAQRQIMKDLGLLCQGLETLFYGQGARLKGFKLGFDRVRFSH